MESQISIIIPTLNEAEIIEYSLQQLHILKGISEIILVDGGSTDETVTKATPYAKVISAPPGRAKQLNTGAKLASGNILLFLHADTILNQAALNELMTAYDQTNVVGGAFKITFSDKALIFKIIALCSNLRAACGKYFFGDQGIFVRRSTFQAVQGFPDVPIMEEWPLIKKLKNHGKLVLLHHKILTSSRRWHKYGIWHTILLMQKIKILYVLKKDLTFLKNMYPNN